jgi:hypothetical protein
MPLDVEYSVLGKPVIEERIAWTQRSPPHVSKRAIHLIKRRR